MFRLIKPQAHRAIDGVTVLIFAVAPLALNLGWLAFFSSAEKWRIGVRVARC